MKKLINFCLFLITPIAFIISIHNAIECNQICDICGTIYWSAGVVTFGIPCALTLMVICTSSFISKSK